MCSTFSFEVQNFFQVLDLFLEFDDQSIICRTDLVRADLCHDFLGSISELQSRDRLLRVIDQGTNGSYQGRSGVSTETILQQSSDLRVTI